jgi:hypothetical protein
MPHVWANSRETHRVLVEKPEKNTSLGLSRLTRLITVKISIKIIVWKSADNIDLAKAC